MILGPVGFGKTYITKKIFNDAYYCSEQKFKQLLVSGQLVMRGPEDAVADVALYPLEALWRKKQVFYDDYGVCDISPAYIEKMLFWLERVDQPNKQTIVTSNLTVEQLIARDDRIQSRILRGDKDKNEKAKLIIISHGKDRRKQNLEILQC